MVTLVYGYGVSGKSAVGLLEKLGRRIAIYDDNNNVEIDSCLEDRRGLPYDQVLENVKLVVVSPSVDLNNDLIKLAKSKHIEVIGELELGFRNIEGSMIAVTGTNGKTTCVELLTKILKNASIDAESYGNIGVGFAENALDIHPNKVAVVEASSFQLSSINLFCPKIAVCLNITCDHLEYHKSREKYIQSKANIFANQDNNEYAILNYDDPTTRSLAEKIDCNTYYFSRKCKVRGAYVCANSVYYRDLRDEYICSVDDINIKGEHNVENALACITACKILNIPNYVIIETLKNFNLPSHRLQFVKKINGVNYFNDSKSTNVSSTLSACKSMKGSTTLIVGGYDKGLCYKQLFDELPIKIHTVIAFGANKEKIIKDASKIAMLSLIKANDIDDAIDIASKVRCENVLFSPATSSFDSFKDYKERGKYFENCVKRLIGDKI